MFSFISHIYGKGLVLICHGVQCHFQQYFSYIMEETGEKSSDLSQVTDKLSHNVVSSTPRHEQGSN
jgi:hypothetical protein